MPVVEKIKSLLHGHGHHHEENHAVHTAPHTHNHTTATHEAAAFRPAEELVAAPVVVEKVAVVEPVLVEKEVIVEPVLAAAVAEPVKRELIEKDVVVHEHIHPVEKEEIQPIIHREREQLEVRQVTERLHETEIAPTLVEKRELAPEVREVVVERAAPIAENIQLPSVEVDATLKSQVVHAPIVNEVVKKTVIEEIQPVLEKDVIVPTLVQKTQPIYEKIVEAPIVIREELAVKELGQTTVVRELGHTTVVEPVRAAPLQ